MDGHDGGGLPHPTAPAESSPPQPGEDGTGDPEPERPAKRLLYIAAVLPPTRVPEADHVLYQSLHFAERGIDTHILTRNGQGILPPPSVTVHELAETWSWRELPAILRLIRRLRPDAVMMSFLGSLYGYKTMPIMLPLLVKLVRPGTTVLVQFANIGQGGGLKTGFHRLLFRMLRRYRYGSLLVSPDVLVALSEDHRQRMLQLAPSLASRIQIVPCCPQMPIAVDQAAARRNGRERLDVAEGETLITFFGRLYPNKGIEQLIEAVALLRRSDPSLRLALIGGFLDSKIFFNTSESYEDELRACVRRHGMEAFTRFSGEYQWDGPEASEYLYASDVAALPLDAGVHLYNSSLAALAAHDLPVIGTRGAVTDPALRHGENLYFLKDRAPETIAAALQAVLGDRALRQRLSQGSASLAAEHFNWRRAAARLSAMLELS